MKIHAKKITLQKTSAGNPIIHISLDSFDMDQLCLQPGKQPDGIFTIMIHHSGESF